jgi:hypothetical protein
MSGALELVRPSEGLFIRDDFYSNDAVADALIGEARWEIVTIGNASTYAFQTGFPHGVLRATTAATANGDGSVLRLFEDGLVVGLGFEMRARVRYPIELASLNFRIGLDDSVTATRPTKGVTIESDAGVLSVNTDSAANGDEVVAVTGHPDLTGGTTAVVGSWLDLILRGSAKANAAGGPAEVDAWVNGRHVAKVPCRISSSETVEAKIALWQDSGGADAVTFDIDYYELWQPRIT